MAARVQCLLLSLHTLYSNLAINVTYSIQPLISGNAGPTANQMWGHSEAFDSQSSLVRGKGRFLKLKEEEKLSTAQAL